MSAPIPRILELLARLEAMRGSDLHLAAGRPALARSAGELVPLADEPFTDEEIRAALAAMVTPEDFKRFDAAGEIDFRWEPQGASLYRANFYKTLGGTSAELRWIPRRIPEMRELGLPEHLARLALLSSGLVLVTGATGSGKSTTMASIVNHANRVRRDHILTIEDPIEFLYAPEACLVSQREVGSHTATFASALRMALREDPDIIVVGEMRDAETMALALEAAETGHLVFATLHTRSAAETVDRIINTFRAEQQAQIRASLAQSLEAVLSLQLVKRSDVRGRVLAMETLVANPAVRNLIRDGKTFQLPNVMQTNRVHGMRTMDDHLAELVQAGIAAPEEALLHARDRLSLAGELRRAGFPV